MVTTWFYFINTVELIRSRLIESVCSYLEIETVITNSYDYVLIDGQTERLADLCIQAGGTDYVSGPAARDYIDEQMFENREVYI